MSDERSLAIGEKALGPGHPKVAASLNNLAVLGQPSPSLSVRLDSISNNPYASRSVRPATSGHPRASTPQRVTVGQGVVCLPLAAQHP